MKDFLGLIDAGNFDCSFAAVNELSKSSSKWLVRLKDICEEVYRVKMVVFVMCFTRWNIFQMVLARILSLKISCALMAQKYKDELDKSME